MRLSRLIPAAFILCMPAVASTQGWIEYTSRADLYAVNFPGEPKVQDFMYLSERAGRFPARLYTAAQGPSRYSVTVVDYSDAEKIHTERAKGCPPLAHTGCTGSPTMGVGAWIIDVRGAMEFAASKYIQGNGKVTFYGWNFIDLVEGRQIHVTNPDGSRTFVAIHMHENRLYVLEGTVPQGYPEPGLFQQSLQFLDKEGKTVRYVTVYTNMMPPPPRSR